MPAPRFAFEVLTLKFDTGIPIVPEHVLSQQEDVNAYTGGIEMAHSGPYSIVSWDQNQKILDLREDWWAIEAGLMETPAVKRMIMVNIGGQVGQNMDIVAQRVVNNEFDATLDMRSSVIGNILAQNPKDHHATPATSRPTATWTGGPTRCGSTPSLRRSTTSMSAARISLAVDRDTIDEILYEGAKIATIYPFPLYPGLQEFADSPEVKALEEKYQPR